MLKAIVYICFMSKRQLTYILTFLLLFTVLVGMQVYFLINSYALKEKQIVELVRSKLKNLEDDRDIFDDHYLKNNRAMEVFLALDEHKITQDSLQNFYENRSKEVSKATKHYLDSLFLDLGYRVSVKKELTSVFSNTSGKELLKNKITIYESAKSEGEEHYLTNGTWEVNFTKSITTKDSNEIQEADLEVDTYGFLLSRSSTFTISNMPWLLFKEILFFAITSILILAAILYIFYRTYKNLLKQEKQITVLHDMVDNVSHEMRTPLATLRLASFNLEKRHQDSDFAVLNRQIIRLEKLLEPLTNPLVTQEPGEYNRNNLQCFLTDLLPSATKTSVRLLTFPKAPVFIPKVSFETIISNLISNSVKYGASKITISVELVSRALHLKVCDNGQGIEESELPYIFKKFYRIQKDNTYRGKGLGLGLYIVKKLVDDLKGNIQVKSQVNQGSEFLIILPYGK